MSGGTVYFNDLSTPGPSGPIISWVWDFGDGGTSGQENPSHTYANGGTFQVVLTVTGTGSDGTAQVTHPVTVGTPATLRALFAAAIDVLEVAFTDESTPGQSGQITGWAWDFGDGNTSTAQNPTHTYADDGTYTVGLTVTGGGTDGTSFYNLPVEVSSAPPPAWDGVPDPPVGAVASAPIFLRNNGNVTTQKLHVSAGTSDGIGNMVWPPKASVGVWTLEDCIAENIAAVPPRSDNGTAEAGFWIGQKCDAARLVAKNNAWMGVWTGAMCDGSDITDLDASGNPHIAMYCEHVTRNCTFQRIKIVHTGDGNAINSEWWYADSTYGPLLPYGGKAGSYNNHFTELDITVPAGKFAIFMDAGTFGCSFDNIIIRGAGDGICLPNNMVDPSHPNTYDLGSIQFLNSGSHLTFHNNAIGAEKPEPHVVEHIRRRDAAHAQKKILLPV